MARLYSDLADSAGRRYYSGLNSATGGLSPAAPAGLVFIGQAPTIFLQVSVFRSPATASLTLIGHTLPSLTPVAPAVGSITLVGLIPSELRLRIITPALPLPDYSTPVDIAPTILYIQTVTPTTGAMQLQALTLNASPGGNIGYITPGVGALSTQSAAVTLIINQPDIGTLTITGLTPDLATELVVQPDIAVLTLNGTQVAVDRGFVWIDTDPPPPLQWTTTTGVAA